MPHYAHELVYLAVRAWLATEARARDETRDHLLLLFKAVTDSAVVSPYQFHLVSSLFPPSPYKHLVDFL